MSRRRRLRRLFARVEPRPRLVDWSLFVLVALAAASGLYSFTVGRPTVGGRAVFFLHAVVGLAFCLLLAAKLRRVRRRLTDRRLRDRATALSAVTAVVALAALGTGLYWTLGGSLSLGFWTLLTVHMALGLLLVPLMVVHLRTRFHGLARADFEGRRTAVRYVGLFVAGAALWRARRGATRLFAAAGDRRFTGSRPADGEGASFPVTSWVADDPEPIDPEEWRLAVRGRVREPYDLPHAALFDATATERRATLDCTSGWYADRRWRGVRVGDLLDRAGVERPPSVAEATGDGDGGAPDRWVRFVSTTGYRWSLPLSEARNALLATHVGGERLSHGHGAPVRLVAPGRRGFQWVKWVERVEVRDRPDPAQWLVTLVSGFDE